MKVFLGFFFVFLLAYASAQAAPIRIAVYGDSLTSGYELQPEEAFPAQLERKLKEIGFDTIEVANMSVAGETTLGGLDRLPSLLSYHPDIVVLELGTNDLMRGVNPGLVQKNLTHIIDRLVQEKIYLILVGTKAPPTMGHAYAQQADAMFAGLAGLFHLPFYPSALEGVTGRQELSLADGIHPNAAGVGVMVEGMYRLVDSGVRWKWNALQYQQNQQQYENGPAAAPVP